jgi:hypothetical protein
MVIDNCLVTFPAALVAPTVKVDVPVVVGIPAITPVVGARLKPVGKLPIMLHSMGVVPIAASVWLYKILAVPFGNDVVVIVGRTAIVMDNDFVLFPATLVAFTVKVDVSVSVAVVVGVPEITPVAAMFKPAGKVPLSRLHVMGVVPVAVSVWLYPFPTAPSGNVSVVIVGATLIVIDNCFVALPATLVAFTVKEDVPSVVGVPEIVPFGAMSKPAGNAPLAMLHVMGVIPVAKSV